MNRLLLSVLAAVTACAPLSSSAPPSMTSTGGRAATIRPGVNNGEGMEFEVARTEASYHHTLPASPERVWEALSAAFRTLEIPVTDVDTSQREIGTRGLTVRGRLGGEPLSRLVNCGRILGGPIANTYRVSLSVLSAVAPAEGGEAQLVTRVAATARDPGSSGAPVACTSTRELEKRIAALTAMELGR